MSDKKKGDRLPTALIEANLDHIIKAGLAADHGHDQQSRERRHDRGRACGLHAELTPGQPDQLCPCGWWLRLPCPAAGLM